MTTRVVKVLIVDGDARVRQALRALAAAARDIVVVGEVAALSNVSNWLHPVQPSSDSRQADVVLLDLTLPQAAQGLALLRELTASRRQPVVVTSIRCCLRAAALAAGAYAFVEKGDLPGALLDAVRAAGALPLTPSPSPLEGEGARG